MQAYRIIIEPVSPGTQAMSGRSLTPGTGRYVQTPEGTREVVVNLTQVQIVGVQGYLVAALAGTDTSTVETAITALPPT